MKRVIVKNLDGIQTNGADLEDPIQWIAECEAMGAWGVEGSYTVEVIDLDQDPAWLLEQCHSKRAAEYPPMSDYLDGIVKGDQAQIDKYIADCKAVKVKYPKP
jgi:hypothetical protein